MLQTEKLPLLHDLARADGICVSVYAPIGSLGRDRLENPIRWKNRLEEARRLLEGTGMRGTDAERMLAPAASLPKDPDLPKKGAGLAVFAAPNRFETVFTPFDVPELVVVGPRFHIRPLIPLLDDHRVYVLALDENSARLLEVTASAVHEIEVPDMPRSRDEALGPEYSEKQRQMHSVGPREHLGSVSHGAGDRGADEKNKNLRYCQAVDRALLAHFGSSQPPLILACEEMLQGIYRNASRYPRIEADAIEGSPARMPDDVLAERARRILFQLKEDRVREALSRFEELEPQGKTIRGVEAVIRAAEAGGVDRLFTEKDAVIWGLVDDEGNPRTLPSQEPGAEDLLNRAAIETLLRGGEVIEVEKSALPPHVAATATLRY
jgi:hypothetical protein